MSSKPHDPPTGPDTTTDTTTEGTTFQFPPDHYRYLGKDGEGYHHHADLDKQFVLVCDERGPGVQHPDHPVELTPGDIDHIQFDDLAEFTHFVEWTDHIETKRGWNTLAFDVFPLYVWGHRTPEYVTLKVGQIERMDIHEPGYLDPVELDGALAILDDRVDKRRVADETDLAVLWLNWPTKTIEHVETTTSGERAGLTDEDLEHAIAERHEVDADDYGTDTEEEPTPEDAEEATAQLRTLSESDRVRLNHRQRPLDVTSVPEDPSAPDATLELVGNGTTYEIELQATYRPKHGLFGATCSWVWTENADRPEPVTDVEVCS